MYPKESKFPFMDIRGPALVCIVHSPLLFRMKVFKTIEMAEFINKKTMYVNEATCTIQFLSQTILKLELFVLFAVQLYKLCKTQYSTTLDRAVIQVSI